MRIANKTFNDMGRMSNFFNQLDRSIKLLKTDEEFKKNFESLRTLINSPFVATLAANANVGLVDSMLKSIVEEPGVESTIETVANIFKCFRVDRFVPVSNEKEMEDLAYVMNQNKTFYAGVYFTNDPAKDTEISYKLRMDRDNTPVTVENRNRFWFPGPEGSFELEMRYHRGFIQIQNGVDMGIIKYVKKHRSKAEAITVKPQTQKISTTTEFDDLGLSLDEDEEEEFPENNSSEPAETTTTDLSSELSNRVNTSDENVQKYGDDSDLAFSDTDWDFDEDETTSTSTESRDTTTPEDQPKSRRKRQLGFLESLLGGVTGAKKEQEEANVDGIKFYTKQFPYPKYVKDDFKKGVYLAQAVQMTFFLALIIHVSSSVRSKIWIRESGNLSLMRTMGLHPNSETFSWIIFTFLEFAVVFFLALIILYVGGLLVLTNKIFIYLFLLIFGAAIISFW